MEGLKFNYEWDEKECDCGKCKYCLAVSSSDHDYEGEDHDCSRCNGAGCAKCE